MLKVPGHFHVLFVCCVLAGLAAPASGIDTASDGWNTWRVEAIDDAPDWCCVHWRSGAARPVPCELDGKGGDYNFSRANDSPPAEMQIYALIVSGELKSVRALGPRCPVTSRSDIVDLGVVPVDASLAWLRKHVEPHSKISSDILAAISVHAGARSRDALLDIARNYREIKNRIHAIFWLGEVRIREAADEIRELALTDGDDEIREQAIFALSRLPDEDAARVLIGIVEDRNVASDTRRSALFWLVESGSETAMDYLTRLFTSR
jgi:hypothetical protein